MKKLLTILCLIFSFASFGQSIQQRATSTVTVMDANAFTQFSFRVPVAPDTTTANTWHTLDSAGKMLFTYDVNGLWMRQNNPHKWSQISSGSNPINDTVYTKAPIAVYIDSTGHQVIYFLQNGLIAGGVITRAACLQIGVTPATYGINFRTYTSNAFILNVSAADPSHPRTDAVVADTLGNVYILTGTPSSTPLAPPIDPSYQILLGTYSIAANASCIGILNEIIYDENLGTPTEWGTSTSGTLTNDFANTINPYHLTIADHVTTYATGSQLIFTKGSNDTSQLNEVLNFFVYLNKALGNNQFQVSIFNGSTQVGNTVSFNVGYGLNPNDSTNYQNVSIPFSALNINPNTVFTKVVIQFAGNDLSGAGGLYIDYIQLQTGGSNVNNQLILTTNGSSGAATLINNVLNIPVYGGGSGNGLNIYNGDSSLAGDRHVNGASHNFTLDSVTTMNLYSIGALNALVFNGGNAYGLEANNGGSVYLGADGGNNTGITVNDAGQTISMSNIASGSLSDSILTINPSTHVVHSINSSLLGSQTLQQVFNVQNRNAILTGDDTININKNNFLLGEGFGSNLNGLLINDSSKSGVGAEAIIGSAYSSSGAHGAIQTTSDGNGSTFEINSTNQTGAHLADIFGSADNSSSTIQYIATTHMINGDVLLQSLLSGALTDSVVIWNSSTQKIGYRDAASFGNGSKNSNIGSGFRLAVPNTNNIKTLFNGLWINHDSTSNTNGITVIADSAGMATYFLRRKDSALYTTIYQNSLKFNITDTANKWVNNVTKNSTFDSVYVYKGTTHTAFKDSIGNNSLPNFVDTLYRTIGKDSLQFTIKGRYHAILDSAGGGGADSAIWKNSGLATADQYDSLRNHKLNFRQGLVNFDSTTIGTDYNRVGLLMNENFSSGSTPSGWTNGGLTVSYTGSKATITGAAAIGAPSSGNPFTAYTSGLQFNSKRMPYEKLNFQMSIVPTTKSAGAVVGVFKGVLGFTIYAQEGIAWDLSNGPNSGRVTITFGSSGAGGNAVPTFTTNVDSTSKMNFSIGDSLILYYYKNGWSVVAGIINKTTGQITKTYFNQRWNGSGGLYNLCFLNGTYVLTNAQVNCLERKGGVLFLGDSQTGGYGVSQQSKRFPEVLFQDNPKYFNVLGLPSMSTRYFDTSGILTEIRNDLQPSKVVFCLGYNDESESIAGSGNTFTAASFKVYADSVIFPLQRAGIPVGVSGIVPRTGSSTDIWNDSLSSLATSRGCDFYDVRTAMKTSGGLLNPAYAYDLHINDTANIIWANLIRAKSGDSLLNEQAADTLYQVRINTLKNSIASSVVNLVGIDRTNTLVSVPNTLFTSATGIQNLYNTVGGSNSQLLAEVHVGSYLGTDSALLLNGTSAGHINFLGYGRTRRNLFITGNSISGSGLIPYFPTTTTTAVDNIYVSTNIGGSGVFNGTASKNLIAGSSLIGATFSGSGNTILNDISTSTLTTANNLILAGNESGRGCITCATGIALITKNGGSQSFASNFTDFLGFGEKTTYDAYVNNDIWFSTGFTSNNNFYFGSKGSAASITTMNGNSTSSPTTNGVANAWTFLPGRSAGLVPGAPFVVKTWVAGTTGTAYNSTSVTNLTLSTLGNAIGNNVTAVPIDASLAVIDTIRDLQLPRLTTTQESAMTTGVISFSKNAGGSAYTNGQVGVTFSGGGCTVEPTGYVVIVTGAVQSAVLTTAGRGCTSAPSVALTSGAGSGATFNVSIGATSGGLIWNSTRNLVDVYNGTQSAVIPMAVASADLTGQNAAGTIASVTSDAANSTYDVGGYVNITAVATDVIQIQVTYTDENSNSQTVSFTTVSTVTNSSYNPVTIRVKGGTTITLKTNLTVGAGSITFDAGGYIRKAY